MKTAPGSLLTGSPAGRTPPHGDGSMYSQANVRAGKVLRAPIRALPSVIVDTEKVLREADGPMKRAVLGRWSLQGALRKPDGDEPVRSPKNTSVNLHSIISSGLIPGGQSSSKRQTVFFLPVDPMDKNHKDPDTIDLEAPRHAQYLHKAWKSHQDAESWVDINLAIAKGLKFYQSRSNAIILQETLPAYCIPKVVRMETGEVFFEKAYMSPRPPPKISLKHGWKRDLGSEHAQRSEVGQR